MAVRTSQRLLLMHVALVAALLLLAGAQGQQIQLGNCYSVVNQNECGSCFVFSTTSMLSTRLCLGSQNGQSIAATILNQATSGPSSGQFVQLSQEYPLNCLNEAIEGQASDVGVCQTGGFPSDVGYMLSQPSSSGSLPSQPWLPTSSAQPYTAGNCDESTAASQQWSACSMLTCPASGAFYDVNGAQEPSFTTLGVSGLTVYTTGTQNGVPISSVVQAIQDELANNGPVVTAIFMCTWNSFGTYWNNGASYGNGVTYYQPPASCDSTQGGHAVMIVGTVQLNGVNCWVIQNSWGTNGGDNGYFYLPIGQNVVEVETSITTVLLPWQSLTSGSASAWTQTTGFISSGVSYSNRRPGAPSLVANWATAPESDVVASAARAAVNAFVSHVGRMQRSPAASHSLTVMEHATLPGGPRYLIRGHVTHSNGARIRYSASVFNDPRRGPHVLAAVTGGDAVTSPSAPPALSLPVAIAGYALAALALVATAVLAVLLVRTRRAAASAVAVAPGETELKTALL